MENNDSTPQLAPDYVVSVGVALYSQRRRVGRAWPLKQYDQRMPTLAETTVMLNEIRAELGEEPDAVEIWARGKGGINYEGCGIIRTQEGKTFEEIVWGDLSDSPRSLRIMAGTLDSLR